MKLKKLKKKIMLTLILMLAHGQNDLNANNFLNKGQKARIF